ncbi:hypothetical protein DHD05_05300 [Arenibacter sp. N53]|uniref:YqiA/YcfP family alpha/beta fold hydrolase n=1 Tax=Arenibacter TaxID=178469 RepID=UPI000CD48C8A|nr:MULTISPECIES: YqiA/YcfP family alpha/beta fold hydrolase [Arenibacter]MCM4151002.1 hypothetical protein [Arenibacter sp. N53]
MNILYLHGLNGSLSEEKRKILQTYGIVQSPSINYELDDDSIENLRKQFQDKDVDVLIGSSIGGFVGFYLSIAIGRPALLFNPALASRSVNQNVPEYNNPHRSFKRLVLGAQDQVVDPSGTLQFVSKTVKDNTDYHISLRQDLAHRIPLEIFEEEVRAFFKSL